MANDIAEKKELLAKLDNAEKAKAEQVSNLKELFDTLTDFEKLAEGQEPEVIISAIRTVVERVIVTQEGEESKVNIKLKGNVRESYDNFFDRSDIFIDEESHDQLCDLGGCRKHHPHHGRGAAAPGLRRADGAPGAGGARREGEDHARLQPARKICAPHRGADRGRAADPGARAPAFLLLPLLPFSGTGKGLREYRLLLHFHRGLYVPQPAGRGDRGTDRAGLAGGNREPDARGVQRVQGPGPGHL